MKWFVIFLSFFLFQCTDSDVGIAPDVERDFVVSDMGKDSKTDHGNTDMFADAADASPICMPGTKTCDGTTKVKTCNENGSAFESVECPSKQECTDGICHPPKICTPGEKKCTDPKTLAKCRSNGEAWVAAPCADTEACIDAKCLSGSPDGQECEQNSDCASGTCHCGTEEVCDFTNKGICVTKSCAGGCGAEGFCVDGSKAFADRTIGYDFCMQKCQGACDSAQQKCVELPAKNGFERGCYFKGFSDIGEACTDNASCIGVLCLDTYFRNSNLCTRVCDAQTPCPANTACVDLNGTFQCIAHCGDGSTSSVEPCPYDLPIDRFDVTCKNRATASGAVARVCALP